MWAVVFGGIQAASPLAFWWLDTATVYALSLVLIASVYIGFAVADGRWVVIAVEVECRGDLRPGRCRGDQGSPWLLVLGLVGHGLKDLWQHRSQFVANTRWWPPFCLVVDWIAATIIAVEIARVFSSTVSAVSPSTPSRSNTAWSVWASTSSAIAPTEAAFPGIRRADVTLVSWGS